VLIYYFIKKISPCKDPLIKSFCRGPKEESWEDRKKREDEKKEDRRQKTEEKKGGRVEGEKMKKNYKLQITNKFQITMSKITNTMASTQPCIHASMQSCNHAFMPYHSQSPLFPSFLSSQLPSFPLYPLAAGGIEIRLDIPGILGV
jgi:hypothetical protein